MNTLKYIFMATSASFGNMFSMAGASSFSPSYLYYPNEILLVNLLTDLPEMAIATDRVDEEQVAQPARWDVRLLRNFMLVFGPLSSIFDYLTFGVLLGRSMLQALTTAQAGLWNRLSPPRWSCLSCARDAPSSGLYPADGCWGFPCWYGLSPSGYPTPPLEHSLALSPRRLSF